MRSLAPTLVLGAATLICCGGTVSATDDQHLEKTDGGGADAGGSIDGGTGGRAGSGGAPSGNGGATTAGRSGTAGASVGGVPSLDGGRPVCPIQVSGTVLDETTCYECIPPGARCDTIQITAESCARVFRMMTTLWCEWYADGVPFTKPWGAVSTCESNPGRVVCGGGL